MSFPQQMEQEIYLMLVPICPNGSPNLSALSDLSKKDMPNHTETLNTMVHGYSLEI